MSYIVEWKTIDGYVDFIEYHDDERDEAEAKADQIDGAIWYHVDGDT